MGVTTTPLTTRRAIFASVISLSQSVQEVIVTPALWILSIRDRNSCVSASYAALSDASGTSSGLCGTGTCNTSVRSTMAGWGMTVLFGTREN